MRLDPDITDERVLAAMRAVPRHAFVPASMRAHAHEDRPLPIGHGATISQPTIVAMMSQLARISPGDRVLELGTGSGYQAAILDALGAEVFSVERVPELHTRAAATLAATGHGGVKLRLGDGWEGWPEHAPYDAILCTAAPPTVPEALPAQLVPGGRLVIPVGTEEQELVVLDKAADGTLTRHPGIAVRFVPLVRGSGGR